MRIGVDVDGVLAEFNGAYQHRFVTLTGRDLFPPGPFEIPCWDYPQFYGYTPDEVDWVWTSIGQDVQFWRQLPPLAGSRTGLWHLLQWHRTGAHDVYFITTRPGPSAKRQTEAWLDAQWLSYPTVLISSQKGAVARALNLDMLVDDRLENIQAVLDEHPSCRAYLFDQPWNRTPDAPGIRITRLEQMFQREQLLR